MVWARLAVALILMMHTHGLSARMLQRSNWRTRSTFVRPASSVIDQVKAEVQNALVTAYGPQFAQMDPLLTLSKTNHGDYQSNLAMHLTKVLKVPPKDVAAKLVQGLRLGPVVGRADVSGPGFVNLHLSSQFMHDKLLAKLADPSGRLGVAKNSHGKKVVIDFSSPNIAKEMHVGHLRSTIIGDCLRRVIAFQQPEPPLCLNHVGDWGTQFGMLIHFLKTRHPDTIAQLAEVLHGGGPADEQVRRAADLLALGDLGGFYKEAKLAFDASPAFQDQARIEVVLLQREDPINAFLWRVICEKSRQEFAQVYKLLEVQLTERGESFYSPYLADVVAGLEAKGLITESDGAKCVFLNPDQPPTIVQKRDGGFLYASTDLAALWHRVMVEGADQIVYVTDSGQASHFKAIFEIAQRAGLATKSDGTPVQLTHVPFGLVLGEDGKRIKTRAGESVKLKALLVEAVERCRDAFLQRYPDMSEEELLAKSRVMGMAAVKYADLGMNRDSNYKFSFAKMLSLQGNTAPYMLYAYVRIQGIKRKAAAGILGVDASGAPPADLDEQFKHAATQHLQASTLVLERPEELALAKQLLRLEDVLQDVTVRCSPHKLCEYLFELAQAFNLFYEACPVLQSDGPTRLSRAALCAITSETIKLSLDLLGIETLERL